MKEISLSQGMKAIVDDEWFDILSNFTWYVEKKGYVYYAMSTVRNPLNNKRSHIAMHRIVLGLSRGDIRQGDHVNGDGLDNRQSNLRIASRRMNQHNRHNGGMTSHFPGVYRVGKNWRSSTTIEHRTIHFGTYCDERNAAQAFVGGLFIHGVEINA
jgi:hypothetical protein